MVFTSLTSPTKGKGVIHVVLAVLAVDINLIPLGMNHGFSSVLLPQLYDNGTEIPITMDEGTWIASIGVISTFTGSVCSGLLMDLVGRKTVIMISTIPYAVGFTLLAFSASVLTLCVARAVVGFAGGLSTAVYSYTAEITLAKLRGLLISVCQLVVMLGILIVHVLGDVFYWKLVAGTGTLISLFAFTSVVLMPETAQYLASKGRTEEAIRSLTFFRGDEETARTELDSVLKIVKLKQQHKGWSYTCSQIHKPYVWKPFVILLILMFLQQMSGMYITVYYAVEFFTEMGTVIDAFTVTIIVSSLRVVSAAFGCTVVHKLKRRICLVYSSVLMGLSMALAGTYLKVYDSVKISHRPYQLFPVICILINVGACMLGNLQCPWLMTAEILPLSVRGILGGAVMGFAYFSMFVLIKVYPLISFFFSLSTILCIFAGSSFLMGLFSLVVLPETKGKSLEEIEMYFLQKHLERENNKPTSALNS